MRISDWSSDVCSSDLRQGQRVVEYVALEQHRNPGVRRELPFHAAIGGRGQEGIDQHDQKRAGRGQQDDEERRRRQQPAVADRTSDVWGKSVPVRVDLGVRGTVTKKMSNNNTYN